MASKYAAFRDKDNALRMLFRAVNGEGYANLAMMKSDPFFDFLRKDARYIEIFNLAEQNHLAFKQALNDDL